MGELNVTADGPVAGTGFTSFKGTRVGALKQHAKEGPRGKSTTSETPVWRVKKKNGIIGARVNSRRM